MVDSQCSYSPLGWDDPSKKNGRYMIALKFLGFYWKNVTICCLAVSTTVLLTLLLDHHTGSTMNDGSNSTLPQSQSIFMRTQAYMLAVVDTRLDK